MGAVADVEDGVALVDGGGERGGWVDGIDVDADEFFEAEEIAFVAAEGSDGEAEYGERFAGGVFGEGLVEVGDGEGGFDDFGAAADCHGDGAADWVVADGAAVFAGGGDAEIVEGLDDVVFAEACGFCWGEACDAADDDGFGFCAVLVVVFGPVVDGEAEVGAGTGFVEEPVECVGEVVGWDGEPVAFSGGVVVRAHEFAGDHADDVAGETDEWAAGVAWVDGAGGLEVGGVGVAEAAVAFTDDAVGDGFAEIEGTAEGEDHVAGADLVGVGDAEGSKDLVGGGRGDFEEGEVELVVLVDEGGGAWGFLAVEGDFEGIETAFDDVPVGDDVAFRGDDGA
jgi:hypothetical protein